MAQCIQWEYDLFVIQSLKGDLIETRAIERLRAALPHLRIEAAEGYLDEELRIDLSVYQNDQTLAGIQVKPLTYLRMRQGVRTFNERANARWSFPVLYLYYNRQEQFENLKAVCEALEKRAK